ncbi:MAG: hypothetical protein QXY45_01780 [Candidatus Aenigmatarchaeota archaeon]
MRVQISVKERINVGEEFYFIEIKYPGGICQGPLHLLIGTPIGPEGHTITPEDAVVIIQNYDRGLREFDYCLNGRSRETGKVLSQSPIRQPRVKGVYS